MFFGVRQDGSSLRCPLFLSSSASARAFRLPHPHPSSVNHYYLTLNLDHRLSPSPQPLSTVFSDSSSRCFLSVISVTCVACSAGRCPVLAAIPHCRVREEREQGPGWKEGVRETSLAAVIGQEVGCLDVQALLSLSLPLPSQWAVSSVAFCFHLFPRLSLPLSSRCLSFSLNWPHRGVDQGPGRLDTSPTFISKLVSVSKAVHVVWNLSNAWTWI